MLQFYLILLTFISEMSFTDRNRESIRKIILSLTPKPTHSSLLQSEFDDSVVAQRPKSTINIKQRIVAMSQQRQEMIQESKRDRVKNKIKENLRHRFSKLCLLGAQEKEAIILRLESKHRSHSSSLITRKNSLTTSPSNNLQQSRMRLKQSQSTIDKFMNNSYRMGLCEVSGQKLTLGNKVRNNQNVKINQSKCTIEGKRCRKPLLSQYKFQKKGYQKKIINPENQVHRIEPWMNDQDFELRGPIYNRRRLPMN